MTRGRLANHPAARDRPRVPTASGRLATGALAALSWLAAVAAPAGCRSREERRPTGPPVEVARTMPEAPASPPVSPGTEGAEVACGTRVRDALAAPALAGFHDYEEARAEVLGRVVGEPMVFVREPRARAASPASRDLVARLRAGRAVLGHVTREEVREAVLREGYLVTADAGEAALLISTLRPADLFDDDAIWLQRGGEVFGLARGRTAAGPVYRFAEGPRAGREATLVFGDRVAAREGDLAAPLHRDLRALAERAGFDRARVVQRGETSIVADLRFGDLWVRALLASEGARLTLACLDAPDEARARVVTWLDQTATRRLALARLREAVDHEVDEALRFDRPEDDDGEHDGQLRPVWSAAYLRGDRVFSYEGAHYAVYGPGGVPSPPQVCVDFVLDSFERASGTWFAPADASPARLVGALDFSRYDLANRRGVIAFGRFAEAHPELFDARVFAPEERVPFGQRKAFFASLAAHADTFAPGDVLAIQGRKRDGKIHQHAILLEQTDPLTGFPYGLADQMKRPRRRTWEGIMGEAPLRSLLYRVRPMGAVWSSLAAAPSTSPAVPSDTTAAATRPAAGAR